VNYGPHPKIPLDQPHYDNAQSIVQGIFLKSSNRRKKMASPPVTLEHVAKAAGVSPSTASRALAGKARQFRISEKTEQEVLKVATGLGFQASHVARSLRTQRSSLIGLLVPDASNPFFAAIARNATIYAERHGLSTLLADSHDSIEHERDLLTHLQSRQVEGLIICPIGDANEHLRQLEQSGANVVVVDRWFSDVRLTTVTSENESGAYAATMEMINLGHRKIGCLQGRPGTSCNAERTAGYFKALQANGIESDPSLVLGDDFNEESGYRSTCQLLDAHPDITAVFAFSNQNMLGALRAFGERGLSIPQDISVITFDDAPFAEYLASPLSVVRQDVDAIGAKAAELLIEQIKTGRQPRKLIHRVPVELRSRRSVGPPKQMGHDLKR
jgi:LacI family transcriptional regulator